MTSLRLSDLAALPPEQRAKTLSDLVASRPSPRLVVIESPYAGDVPRNVAYAVAAMRDCLARGEAPIASHLLYAATGALDDATPSEREHGIAAGLAWGAKADATVVYADLGESPGMTLGIERARAECRPIEYRKIQGWR